MLRKTIAALAVAAFALIASPTAAFAADTCAGVGDQTYANSRAVTSDSYLVDPGGTFNVTWQNGYFAANAPVTVTISGNFASDAKLTSANSSSPASGSTLSGVADANGSFKVTVSLPRNASGSYLVSGTSAGACGGVSVGVLGAFVNSPAGQTTRALVSSGSRALAATGGTVPTVLLVSGGGALLFGAILLLARSRARRHSQE